MCVSIRLAMRIGLGLYRFVCRLLRKSSAGLKRYLYGSARRPVRELLMFADQVHFDVRCEWGSHALHKIAASDVVVIVDVLSFSTCVEIAVANGAMIYPFPMGADAPEEYSRRHGAHLATRRGTGLYSLSPTSLESIPSGTRLVLPSPNGSNLSFHAQGDCVLAGCIRNARAVARFAMRKGKTVTVIPAGERWKDDGLLRPAIEDCIGAGALIEHLEGTLSPEARMARAVFREARASLYDTLLSCASGRELDESGFSNDVKLAAMLDVSDVVPVFHSPAYVRGIA